MGYTGANKNTECLLQSKSVLLGLTYSATTCHYHVIMEPQKQKIHCWINVGPPPATPAQHCPNNGYMSSGCSIFRTLSIFCETKAILYHVCRVLKTPS